MIMKTLRIHAGTALLAVVCLLAGGCHPAVRPPASSAEDPLAALRNNLPRIDGSTSTIPLDAGIRATLLGISQEEAEKQVAHSTTYGSFQKLLEGTCDVILSTPLSAEQEQAAREAGVTLELTPIAREAFVFAVNAKNPVTGLTQQPDHPEPADPRSAQNRRVYAYYGSDSYGRLPRILQYIFSTQTQIF